MRKLMWLAVLVSASACTSLDGKSVDGEEDPACLTEAWPEHDECCQVEGFADIVCRQGYMDDQGQCQTRSTEHSRVTRQCADWADTGGSYITTGQWRACEDDLPLGLDCCVCEWQPDAQCRPCEFLD